MTYQALMFDIDGTLTNSLPAYTNVMRIILKEYDRDFSTTEAQATFPMAIEQVLPVLDIPANDAAHFEARYQEVMNAHFGDIQLFPGIADLFEQLPSDLKLGIVTSQLRDELDRGMRPYALMKRMAVTISADDTPKHKPDPQPLLTALERVNVAPADALFIGDSLSDEQTAAAAGVDFGLAVWGMDPNAQHLQTRHRLEHPRDLLALVQQ